MNDGRMWPDRGPVQVNFRRGNAEQQFLDNRVGSRQRNAILSLLGWRSGGFNSNQLLRRVEKFHAVIARAKTAVGGNWAIANPRHSCHKLFHRSIYLSLPGDLAASACSAAHSSASGNVSRRNRAGLSVVGFIRWPATRATVSQSIIKRS